MTLVVALVLVLVVYVGTTVVQWWRDRSVQKLHEFAAAVVALVALIVNASAIAEHDKRLDQYLQRAALDAFHDEDWNITLRLVGDTGYALSTPIKLLPTFFKGGLRPLPTHSGDPVEIHPGDFTTPEPGKRIVIHNADAILCGRQPDDRCKDMILLDVWAQLGDMPPVRVDRKVPTDAN